MMTKQEIIDYIATIVNFCVADGNTYLYAKCSPTIKQDCEKIPIGGGNFTILLSTLATLEFLATIDAILNSKEEDFYTEKEVKEIENKKKELENDEFLKNLLLAPKVGDLKKSSGKILKEFLINTANLTGINKRSAGKLQTIRNKLAHEFTPKIMPAAGIPAAPGTDFVNLILNYKNFNVFCLTSNNTTGIDSNALNHKLSVLLKYIIEKIVDLNKESEILNRINNYIKNTK